MRILFFGTPDYVLPIVEALHKEFNSARDLQFIGVVTQSPKPTGRKQMVERSAVDNWAFKHKLSVIYDFDDIPDFDLGIVASYGRIIPQEIIDIPKYGLLNVHPSKLPAFRGASPVQAQIALGETAIAVSIIKMDKYMDHGPIVSAFPYTLMGHETTEELRKELFALSAPFIMDLLPHYIAHKIKLKPQNHDEATFTKAVTKQDGYINPTTFVKALEGTEGGELPLEFAKASVKANAQSIDRLVRALTPWPGVWTTVRVTPEADIKRLRILETNVKDDALVLLRVQLEGKGIVTWKQFTEGYPQFRFEQNDPALQAVDA